MIGDLTAEEVRALLKLEPHATCGFVTNRPTACAHFNKAGAIDLNRLRTNL